MGACGSQACGSQISNSSQDVTDAPTESRQAPTYGTSQARGNSNRSSPSNRGSRSGTAAEMPTLQPPLPDGQPDDGSLLGHDVIIRELSFRPDLEGERGSVILWDEYESQYTVELQRHRCGRSQPNPAPAHPASYSTGLAFASCRRLGSKQTLFAQGKHLRAIV